MSFIHVHSFIVGLTEKTRQTYWAQKKLICENMKWLLHSLKYRMLFISNHEYRCMWQEWPTRPHSSHFTHFHFSSCSCLHTQPHLFCCFLHTTEESTSGPRMYRGRCDELMELLHVSLPCSRATNHFPPQCIKHVESKWKWMEYENHQKCARHPKGCSCCFTLNRKHSLL